MKMNLHQSRVLAVGATLFVGMCAYGQSLVDQAVAAGRGYIRANAASYGLSNPDRDLQVRTVRQQRGQFTVRFDQYYQGVRVFEGEAIAHVNNGAVTVTSALRGNINVSVRPNISAQAAEALALRTLGARGDANATSALEILPKGSRSPMDFLVWHVVVNLDNDVDQPGNWDFFIDAQSGLTLWSFNSLKTETATGHTMYSGDVTLSVTLSGGQYSLVDPLRGGGNETRDANNRRFGKGTIITSPTASFGNGQHDSSDPDTAGADAAYGVAATWDYYAGMFGRDGIDANGRKTYSKVHYSRGYENAFWSDSCFCMTYGDGRSFFFPLVSVDVTGHELSHGVMAAEANLTYSGESGGLNESNSDIFGTMVEFAQNNPLDTPDYWIGERIMQDNWPGGVYTETVALRYMDDPHKDGTSPACWSPTLGSLDVHYSSGPNNHMYYLLSHGGTSKCNGQVVSGVGNDKAARIWYEAISNHMTASTNYAGARTAALAAAAVLYGNGSAEQNAVAAAFAAINVN